MEKGRLFTVPFVPDGIASEATPLFASSNSTSHGHFKDGIFDCFAYGPFHPSLCSALIVPQILMAQVLTRMKLDWCGNENDRWHVTFRRVLILVIIYWVVSLLMAPPRSTKSHYSFWRWLVYNLVTSVFGVYTCIVLMKL